MNESEERPIGGSSIIKGAEAWGEGLAVCLRCPQGAQEGLSEGLASPVLDLRILNPGPKG